MPLRLSSRAPDFHERFEAFLHHREAEEADVDRVAASILADVSDRGDEAILAYTSKFDRLALAPHEMRLSDADLAAAAARAPADAVDALRLAADRIRAYHARQLPEPFEFTDEAGVVLGSRWSAIDAVGIYVPGGTAAYPSSVLMNAIPAVVAGVPRVAMVVPTPDGAMNDLVLAAAGVAGVTEIYRIGGAQAVAALAYGTESIRPVEKIVGPGNAYVASAKKQVFGKVGIDMIAGPSEILVVADADNDPHWIAADLLSQAEHDVLAQSILIADDAAFADRVAEAVEQRLQELPRAQIARQSWEDHGAVIVVESLDNAPDLINRLAPEHLELAVANPEAISDKVRHAGAIFLGRYTPEAIGDYVAGPNHVLPTSRSARFSSGLGVLDFMKRTSLVKCDRASLAQIGPAAVTLAEAEGLDAHAASVAVRIDTSNRPG